MTPTHTVLDLIEHFLTAQSLIFTIGLYPYTTSNNLKSPH